ncbi:unnamed protein product, partial [marine sediment metagenome]
GDQDEGWVFEANPRWYRRVPELFEVVAYDLTHVGVVTGRPVLTWWGAAHGRALKLDRRVLARIKAIEDGSHVVCPECNGTNTRTVVAAPEDLERWGVLDPGRQPGDRPPTQHRFKCDDCGHVDEDGLEPVPKARVRATRPVDPHLYNDFHREPFPRGHHWNDGDLEDRR